MKQQVFVFHFQILQQFRNYVMHYHFAQLHLTDEDHIQESALTNNQLTRFAQPCRGNRTGWEIAIFQSHISPRDLMTALHTAFPAIIQLICTKHNNGNFHMIIYHAISVSGRTT